MALIRWLELGLVYLWFFWTTVIHCFKLLLFIMCETWVTIVWPGLLELHLLMWDSAPATNTHITRNETSVFTVYAYNHLKVLLFSFIFFNFHSCAILPLPLSLPLLYPHLPLLERLWLEYFYLNFLIVAMNWVHSFYHLYDLE